MNFPIFPLNGAILFPNTNLPLNIFEDRYIDMVDYALSHKRLIGMIQTKKNEDFFTIGCLGKITNFTETSDGRYQINLEGINRFRVKKIFEKNHKTFEKKMEKLKSTLGSEIYRKKRFKENKLSKELFEYLISRMKDEFEYEEQLMKRLTWREHVVNTKKFKEFEPKIMEYLDESEDYALRAGIPHEFVQKETEKLVAAIDNYIKAAEKRGV